LCLRSCLASSQNANLHLGTDAAPTAFAASTPGYKVILSQPSSYPLCDIAGHRPSTAHVPLPAPLLTQTSHSSYFSPDPATFSELGDGSQAPAFVSPILRVPTDPPPPTTVVAVLQDIPPHPSRALGSISLPVASNSVQIAQDSPIAVPTVPEWIGTAIIRGPELLVRGEASASSADDLAPQIHTSELGEASQALIGLSQHPDPIPATITPVTVPDPGVDPDGLQDAPSSGTLSRTVDGNKQ
jgi:hypothetical protein